MEKLLNKFEEHQYQHHASHVRGDTAGNAVGAPASVHSGTNEDLSVVADPTENYIKGGGGSTTGQGNYPISSKYHHT